MRKIGLFAIAAAVIATGVGVWATSTTKARVPASMGQGIEPFQIMVSTKGLAAAEPTHPGFVSAGAEANPQKGAAPAARLPPGGLFVFLPATKKGRCRLHGGLSGRGPSWRPEWAIPTRRADQG